MPLVSKTFDQLLDFTRTTSGTFVGSNGLVQTTPASVNLLTQTQQFDNAAWAKSDVTVTANTTVAPDGTSTADTITLAPGTAAKALLATASAGAANNTFSFYVKADGHNFIQIANNSGGGVYANFNLTAGAEAAGSSGATVASSSVESAGGGWWRCRVTFDSSAGTNTSWRFYFIDSATAAWGATTSSTGSMFLWGAQLEAASAASTYTRNNGGVFPPRFDYDPVTLAAKGLLIEEQRTNLLTYSEQFDNAAWTKVNTPTIVSNVAVAPDGTTTADSIQAATAGAFRYIIQTATVSSNATVTASVYVKKETSETVFGGFALDFQNGTRKVAYIGVNAVTGAAVNLVGGDLTATISVVDAGAYWRVVATTTDNGANTSCSFYYYANLSLDNISVNGSSSASSPRTIWGTQLEAGAFATSYIPTVASQVTRAADQTSIVAPNFAPWYNASEGTFVFEGSILGDKGATTVDFLQASDGVSNSIAIDLGMFGVAFPFFAVSNTTSQANLGLGTLTVNPPFKMAGAYKVNDFAGVLNGGTVQTDTSGTVPSGIAQLGLGNRLGGVYMNGHIRSIRYFPTRLSNAQLQALTA